MKRYLLTLCIVLILLTSSAHARERLQFVADVDFPPYSMLIDGRPAGIDVEVMTMAAERAGYLLDIQFRQWDELVRMVEQGECDGTLAYFRDPERERYAMFMEGVPVHLSSYVLFTKVGRKFAFESYDDLKGRTIGKVSGIALGKEFDEAAASGMVVKQYEDMAQALRALLEGDIEALAGNIDVVYYRLKQMGMTSSIVYLPKKILEDRPAFTALSRASKLQKKEEVILRLERELDKMRKDGTYNKIAKRYLFRF